MMNGGPCPRCSALLRPCCRCGAIPSNLAFLKKVVNKPKSTKRCRHKRPRCVTLAAGGDSIDCLCCFDENLATSSDRRLQTWQRELQLRNNIADRLVQRTGKAYCELLFNRSVTVDGRDKSMTQRLLAHAESVRPQAHQKKAAFTECYPNGCCTMELISAQPAKQRYFEVSGLPAGVKCELIGENCCVRRSGWVTSRAVQENIAAKVRDIRRVLPFFPEIEYLQIIGRQMKLYEKPQNFDEYACSEEVDEQENIDEPCTIETCPTYANIAIAEDAEDCEVATDENAPEVNEAEQQQKGVDDMEAAECVEAEPCTIETCPTYANIAIAKDVEDCEVATGENAPEVNDPDDLEAGECVEADKNMAALAVDEQEIDAISCSDSDIDFYREFLSNRAKCHDIFYRL